MVAMLASAPGKLVLLGDYAVLESGAALVAAVDRRAVGTLAAASPAAGDPAWAPAAAPSPVVEAVLSAARRVGAAVNEGPLAIDTARFRDEAGRKVGLGSSSAAAVVAAALVTGRGDERTLGVALEAHRAAAGGEGSGVDVAASYHGGVIATRRQPAPVTPLPRNVRGLAPYALYTGRSASTPELIRACRAAPRWKEYVGILDALAGEGVRAWAQGDARGVLSVASRAGRALAALGRDAGVEVVTETIAAIMRLADEAGIAAKPSGAGGGDVAVVFAFDGELPQRIAEKTGAVCLDLAVDPHGLTRER